MSYQLNTNIRLVTAAALFDGHDAAINIMRRILQSKGAEIIHLGHNRSVAEIVECAIEEDVNGIAITSYQGGHVEFFKYMRDLLEEAGCGHIKIFGGGGGTILPTEIDELHGYGITRIYSPDDGRKMGLEGMIEDVLKQCSPPAPLGGTFKNKDPYWEASEKWNGKLPLGERKDIRRIARAITLAEAKPPLSPGGEASNAQPLPNSDANNNKESLKTGGVAPVLGITGTGGAGKSSVTDEIVRRYLNAFNDKTIAVISVDPSKKKTGGALLGDRIRMNSISSPRAYMRSLATRDSEVALSAHVQDAIDVCHEAGFDFIVLESAGVGQSDASILDYCDVSMYVMTPEYGAASQLEKINMLDYADIVVINKFDKAGSLDSLADVRKQYKRNHLSWTAKDEELPIIGTTANRFNDEGINDLFRLLLKTTEVKTGTDFGTLPAGLIEKSLHAVPIIPPKRVRYLSEISENNRGYDKWATEQCAIATKLYQVNGLMTEQEFSGASSLAEVKKRYEESLHPECKKLIAEWPELVKKYSADFFEYEVRGRIIKQPLTTTSLSGTRIPKVVVPKYKDWGDILAWQLQENLPGEFPFTAGVFELKRAGEDPTRMFAGEGGPERTNRRFHYVSEGQPAKRLSTAFDSVTLYGEDPDVRPDIYGKIGNAGVSIATVDDAKKLYSGFDLCDPKTSVSMTINGPAPMLLAFFMNAAIDQQCEKYIIENSLKREVNDLIKSKYNFEELPTYMGRNGKVVPRDGDLIGSLPVGNNGLGLRLLGLSGSDVLPADVYQKIKAHALSQVRGTVQADILKEDQAQNTCIFSTEFALKLMGDVQEYFITNQVRNFYSVSISGYHIAEAGANPITQLAFTVGQWLYLCGVLS
jgi:methylmalonyl-CoA mutase